jgi:hypothetical protein
MRLHIGHRYWTIPGFGWRYHQIWDDAEVVEVRFVEHLWNVYGDETEVERAWTCTDRTRALRAKRVDCVVCGDLEPKEASCPEM